MESTTSLFSFSSSSSMFQLIPYLPSSQHLKTPSAAFKFPLSIKASSSRGFLCSANERQRRIRSLESKYCYDKAIPEQIIEKPIGLSVGEKKIGCEPRCGDCEAKGAVLCATCGGSGLYVDSILECQGIIVKVRCLGCGGTGNIMCSECGGRGHL